MVKGFFQFILFGIVFIAIIIYQFFFSKKAVVKRSLKKFPVTRIGNFKEGERGRITGTIIYAGKILEAPLSGRECCHYYVHIEESSGGKSNSWNTLVEEEITGTVVLQDGNHYALMKHANLKSYIVQDRDYSSGTFNDATPQLEAYLNDRGHESVGVLGFNKSIRYKEGILEQGERVTVAGLGEWKQAEDVGLPAEYGTVLVMRSGTDTIYMSDARDIVNG
ncbi:hypothetical protein ACLI1A_06715 [Flavobacterium sp. RHBU_3]|uniref:hypothetical protein n=1 Tax=Flavobacterium sp. RHBU_3 TaxID=3391184 RepID=UPI0039855672